MPIAMRGTLSGGTIRIEGTPPVPDGTRLTVVFDDGSLPGAESARETSRYAKHIGVLSVDAANEMEKAIDDAFGQIEEEPWDWQSAWSSTRT